MIPRPGRKSWLALAGLAAGLCALGVLLARRHYQSQMEFAGISLKRIALDAYGGRPEASSNLVVFGAGAVPGLIHLLNERDAPLQRSLWFMQLRFPPWAAKRIIPHLKSPNAVLTREAAAVCLGRLGTNAAPAASALARALSDREGAVRIYAVASLSHIGKAAVPSLVRVISGKDGPARMAAIEALGRMRLEAVESIPVLLEALDDPEPGVRAAASFSLGLIGAPAIPGLVAVILQGKPPPRDSALASLRSMTRPIELRVFRTADEATIRALVSLFHAPWPEARLVAVQVLDRIPTKARAAEAELRKLLDDPDEAVREAARALVERMGPGKRGEGNW